MAKEVKIVWIYKSDEYYADGTFKTGVAGRTPKLDAQEYLGKLLHEGWTIVTAGSGAVSMGGLSGGFIVLERETS